MPLQSYQDFDLHVTRELDGYVARLIASPVGQASTRFTLPWNTVTVRPPPSRFDQIATDIEFWCSASSQEATPLTPKELGSQLYAALCGGEVGVALLRSVDAAQAGGAGLRLRLHLNETPELAALPWEYLYDRTRDRFVVLAGELSLVRYLELPEPERVLHVTQPLCILAMLADPSDVSPRLDVAREWELLRTALADQVDRGQVQLDCLTVTTADALQQRLRRGDVHILHFVGHGWAAAANGQTVTGLLCTDEAGNAQLLTADVLGVLLHDQPMLHLLFLNACSGASGDTRDAFRGMAQHLVRQGLPGVIAMQFPITDRAATRLAQEFYRALADGYPLDAALTEARKAVYALGGLSEWGTPVFFSRSAENRVLDRPEDATGKAELLQPVIERKPFEPETVLVPAGPFRMGSAPGPGVADYETPQTTLVLPAYRIGKYSVTNAQYKVFLHDQKRQPSATLHWGAHSPPAAQENRPVSGVTWHEALDYCQWLAEKTGRRYTLPSEAQWEKAARGTDGRVFPWGDEWDPTRCHHNQTDTATVDAYPPQSVYGCYDMVGNVREWTCSLWGEQPLAPDKEYEYPWRGDARDDERNDLKANDQVRRIYRGGAASDPIGDLRCAARNGYLPTQPGPFRKGHGFRVALLIDTDL